MQPREAKPQVKVLESHSFSSARHRIGGVPRTGRTRQIGQRLAVCYRRHFSHVVGGKKERGPGDGRRCKGGVLRYIVALGRLLVRNTPVTRKGFKFGKKSNRTPDIPRAQSIVIATRAPHTGPPSCPLVVLRGSLSEHRCLALEVQLQASKITFAAMTIPKGYKPPGFGILDFAKLTRMQHDRWCSNCPRIPSWPESKRKPINGACTIFDACPSK